MVIILGYFFLTLELQSYRAYLRTCAPNEDSDQPVRLRSLIRIFTRRILDN